MTRLMKTLVLAMLCGGLATLPATAQPPGGPLQAQINALQAQMGALQGQIAQINNVLQGQMATLQQAHMAQMATLQSLIKRRGSGHSRLHDHGFGCRCGRRCHL